MDITIDPTDGSVTFYGRLRLYSCMPEEELLAIHGCRRNSGLDNTWWYWFPHIEYGVFPVDVTPHTTDLVLSSITMTVETLVGHQSHVRIAEASLGLPTATKANPEWWGNLPPFNSYPVWEFPWGTVVAGWDGRWERCQLSIRYSNAPHARF